LVNINEENIRRIDEYDNEKFNFEQELNEKDRQITERDEKIQDIQLTLEQTKESRDKLRKALQKKNETMTNNEQTDSQDAGKIFRNNCLKKKTKYFLQKFV
jgi:chromosome segregation ATPase